MDDFYFAYDFTGESASRLYRCIGGAFERYNPVNKTWIPDPEQCRIFIGEDIHYEEISEEQAKRTLVIA